MQEGDEMTIESDLRAAIHKIACDFETLIAEMREHRCDTVNLLEDKPPAPIDCTHESGFRASVAAWHESCNDCGHLRRIAPPAPPFVLGPKTKEQIKASLNYRDGDLHTLVARETARLIAEWVDGLPTVGWVRIAKDIREGAWGIE